MRCETIADPQVFWERASGFLLGDPVVNNVLLTTASTRRKGAMTDAAPATFVAVIDDGGTVVGAAMRTPPFNVYLSPMPVEAVELLADATANKIYAAVGYSPVCDVTAHHFARGAAASP